MSSDVTIGEGKTVITFWGTGKSIETGEMEEINRDCVLEYELDAEVLHLEETPELVENVWDPKEKGQQGLGGQVLPAGTDIMDLQEFSLSYASDDLIRISLRTASGEDHTFYIHVHCNTTTE